MTNAPGPTSDEAPWDKEKLQERLAKLSGGVALIRVGAVSEAELKRLRDAFDDAISSTRAAVAEGIVPGGLAALLRSIAAVEAVEEQCEAAERAGVHVVRMALEVPARQIARNAGVDEGPVVERIRAGRAPSRSRGRCSSRTSPSSSVRTNQRRTRLPWAWSDRRAQPQPTAGGLVPVGATP